MGSSFFKKRKVFHLSWEITIICSIFFLNVSFTDLLVSSLWESIRQEKMDFQKENALALLQGDELYYSLGEIV